MKLLTAFSICLLLFSIAGHAQTIEIGFDSTGKMVKFPPPVIRPHAKLRFTITTPKEFVQNQLNAFTTRLKKTIDYVTTIPDSAFYCIFGITSHQYAGYLKKDTYYIDSLGICNRPDPLMISHLDSGGWVPLANYLHSVYDSQFEVKIVRGNTVIDSVWLTFVADKCKNTCLTFQSKLDKNVRDLTTLKCPSCSIDSLSFQLVYHNPFNNTIVGLFNAHFADLHDFDKDNFIADFLPISSADTPDSAQCLPYATALGDFKLLNRWLKTWLWYTGKFTINPFPVATASRQKQIRDSIDLINIEMDTTQELERYVDSAKVKMRPTDWRYDTYKHLIERRLTLKQIYSQDSTLLVILKKEQDQEFASIDKLARTSSYIYGGKLMVSRSGRLVVQKQFDANDFIQPVYKNRRQLDRVTNLPENERLVLMVHNADSNAAYTANEKPASFNDLETFTMQVTNALSAASVNTATTAQYNNFGNAIGALFSASYTGLVAKGAKFVFTQQAPAHPCECSQAFPIIKAIYDSLNNRKDTFPAGNLFKPQPLGKALNSTVVLRTLLYFHSKAAPYSDTIMIKNTVKKDSAFTYFQVGALRIFQLAAGILFLRQPLTTTQIDTANGSLKPVTSTTAASAFFGFKLYVFAKNYNLDNGLIPRYPFRRVSVFAGFDFLHPLNNFYVGGGYDVIPGLSVLAGNNYYLRTFNEIQNNQIINTTKSYRSGGFVYGVTVNPILFAQFIKTFF